LFGGRIITSRYQCFAYFCELRSLFRLRLQQTVSGLLAATLFFFHNFAPEQLQTVKSTSCSRYRNKTFLLEAPPLIWVNMLSLKTDYRQARVWVADRRRTYTHVQFFRRIGVQTLLGDDCLVNA
jgi:hypothetical protein